MPLMARFRFLLLLRHYNLHNWLITAATVNRIAGIVVIFSWYDGFIVFREI